jgi:NADPH-dependent 2,4-dienoyl-CoA reductase/sulfur reductase-like enzyme
MSPKKDGIARILVVGAGLAALRTIESLRDEGFAGEIVVLGDEPVLPYDRPPLSKQFLKGDWDDEKISLMRSGTEALDVDWRLGARAAALDGASRQVKLESGETVDYDALVIATGTRARRLPFGEGLAGIHVLRSFADVEELKRDLETAKHVVVVGAGFIGMEVAATCRERGHDVTVVEPLPTPLVRGLGTALGEFVADTHRAHGVDIRCGVGVAGFTGDDRVRSVELADGASLACDVVIVGIGVVPNTEWLEGSGLDVTDGVLCDATGATPLEGVFAVGDVSRWANPLLDEPRRMEHWTNAVEQSTTLAKRIVHGEAEPFAPVPYVWTDQFELRIAIAGEVREGDEMVVTHGSLEEGRCLCLFGSEGRLHGAVGFKRPRPLLAMRRRMAEGITWEEALAENA